MISTEERFYDKLQNFDKQQRINRKNIKIETTICNYQYALSRYKQANNINYQIIFDYFPSMLVYAHQKLYILYAGEKSGELLNFNDNLKSAFEKIHLPYSMDLKLEKELIIATIERIKLNKAKQYIYQIYNINRNYFSNISIIKFENILYSYTVDNKIAMLRVLNDEEFFALIKWICGYNVSTKFLELLMKEIKILLNNILSTKQIFQNQDGISFQTMEGELYHFYCNKSEKCIYEEKYFNLALSNYSNFAILSLINKNKNIINYLFRSSNRVNFEGKLTNIGMDFLFKLTNGKCDILHNIAMLLANIASSDLLEKRVYIFEGRREIVTGLIDFIQMLFGTFLRTSFIETPISSLFDIKKLATLNATYLNGVKFICAEQDKEHITKKQSETIRKLVRGEKFSIADKIGGNIYYTNKLPILVYEGGKCNNDSIKTCMGSLCKRLDFSYISELCEFNYNTLSINDLEWFRIQLVLYGLKLLSMSGSTICNCATNDTLSEEKKIKSFISEYCIITGLSDDYIVYSKLFESYKEYCISINSITGLKKKNFKEIIIQNYDLKFKRPHTRRDGENPYAFMGITFQQDKFDKFMLRNEESSNNKAESCSEELIEEVSKIDFFYKDIKRTSILKSSEESMEY